MSNRLALISDIHGNDVAFAAVERDIDRLGIVDAVCLGDIAQGGPQPAAALARLVHRGWDSVRGNSDDFLLEIPEASAEPITEAQLTVREWSVAQLTEQDLVFLRSLPLTLRIQGAGTEVLAFHASPRSNEDVLLPWSGAEAVAPFDPDGADVLAGGHTHTQWTRRIDGALFVNPGSVGLAYDHHQPEEDFKLTPVAEYAVLTMSDGGAAVEFRRVPYSLDELLQALHQSGRPGAAAFAGEWRRP